MSNQKQFPVLISGAGPVGLFLGLSLVRKGIPVTIFEQEAELCDEMRASTIHASTCEMLHELGVLDEILAEGYITRKLQYWERASKKLIAEFSYDLISEDTPFPFRLQCPQNIVSRILRDAIEAARPGTVLTGHRVAAFWDKEDHVEVEVMSSKGLGHFDGAFMVGCDGARSVVRKTLGLSFTGKTYEDRFLLVGSDIDFSRYYQGLGEVAYLYDPAEWVILLRLPGIQRTVFRLKPDEDEEAVQNQAAIKARMAQLIPSGESFEVLLTKVYKVHQRVAETFRVGRAILAGDAAHLNNPVGGMGMNSGIHDAAMLAEVLHGVYQGAGHELLDEYSNARRHAAVVAVHRKSGQNYADMVARDFSERQARNERMEAMACDPSRARAYLLEAAMLDARI